MARYTVGAVATALGALAPSFNIRDSKTGVSVHLNLSVVKDDVARLETMLAAYEALHEPFSLTSENVKLSRRPTDGGKNWTFAPVIFVNRPVAATGGVDLNQLAMLAAIMSGKDPKEVVAALRAATATPETSETSDEIVDGDAGSEDPETTEPPI